MFSLKTQYGLKAVLALAANYGKKPIQARRIASSQDIPARYLELLLAQLRRARMVEATRGKNGGYILAYNPARISVWDIVSIFEGKMTFQQKIETSKSKRAAGDLSAIWKEAEKRMVDYLKSVKISKILESLDSGKQMYFI